jgi:Matrixin
MPLPEETTVFPLHADADFSPIERTALYEGIDIWYFFTRGKILFQLDFDLDKSDLDTPLQDDFVLRVDYNFHLIQEHFKTHRAYCYGAHWKPYSDSQRGIYLATDLCLNLNHLSLVFAHELGHYLDLGHIQYQGIMYPYTYPGQDLSISDAEEFCRVYSYCSINEFNWKV